MGYLTERLMQTVFLSAGFPFSRLFSFRSPPEINSMKWDWILRFRERRLALCAHNTNWDAKPRCRTDFDRTGKTAIVEDPFQQEQEELMLSADFPGLSPQYRGLIEMLFLETPPRTYTEVAADSGPEPGSVGFLCQKCLQHLGWRLAELGFL